MSKQTDPLQVLPTIDCQKIMENFLESKDFKIDSIDNDPIKYQFNGLVTDQSILKIHYQLNNKYNLEGQFFVKVINESNKVLTQFIKEMQAYEKECFYYTKLIPLLQENGVVCDFLPKHYLCESSVIVLEDLTLSSYKPFTKNKYLDLDQCKMCLKIIADFHAKPMIYEHKKSTELGRKYKLSEDYAEILENRLASEKYEFPKKYFQCSFEALLELLPLLPENGISKDNFSKKLVEYINILCNSEVSENTPLTVIHGDLWVNNFLYRTENYDMRQCKIIDFQTISYGPPGQDVAQFLLTNTSMKFYIEHKNELLGYYYDQFSNILEDYGIIPCEILPREELILSCSSFELFGKLFAVIDKSTTALPDRFLREVFHPETFETFLFADKGKYLVQAFENDSTYREIMKSNLIELMNISQ